MSDDVARGHMHVVALFLSTISVDVPLVEEQTGSGCRATIVLQPLAGVPPDPPPPLAPVGGKEAAKERDEDGNGPRHQACRTAITRTLVEVGRPAKAEEIKRELQARNRQHGESTVNNVLADMIRDGVLDNHRGRGYWFTDA